MNKILNSYLDSLEDRLALAKVRLVIYEESSLSCALLNVQIKWIEFKITFIEAYLK